MPQIRPYRPGDWTSFLALDIETGLAALHAPAAVDMERYRKAWPNVLREKFSWTDSGPGAPGSTFLVLEDDGGTYAGHLWLTEDTDVFTGEPKLWVTTVAVVPACRGRGWGRLLMTLALAEARKRGIPTVALNVDAQNASAEKLYAALGFAVTRKRMEHRLP